MSIYVTSAAWKNSRATGSVLLLLLAICDFSDDEGVAYPAIKTLAAKARIAERTAQYAVSELIGLGELCVDQGAGPKGCNLYRVQVQKLRGANSAGVQSTTKGGAVSCTQTVIEPSIEVLRQKRPPKPKLAPIGFELETGKFTNIEQQAMDLKAGYPGIDLDASVNRAAIWIVANPTKRPTSNYGRFLTSWLGRDQKRLEIALATGQAPPKNFTDQKRDFINALTGKTKPPNQPPTMGEIIDG